MPNLESDIKKLLMTQPGLTDREITDALFGPGHPQQSVNATCRRLERLGVLIRARQPNGLIGNFLANNASVTPAPNRSASTNDPLSEDSLKKAIEKWLKDQGWHVNVAWSNQPGIDIEATRNGERWIIEVKGRGSRPPMRVNYFLAVLGELLQRMCDPKAKYSIALPDLEQYRRLWERLPQLAKKRTGISALFVDNNGKVQEC